MKHNSLRAEFNDGTRSAANQGFGFFTPFRSTKVKKNRPSGITVIRLFDALIFVFRNCWADASKGTLFDTNIDFVPDKKSVTFAPQDASISLSKALPRACSLNSLDIMDCPIDEPRSPRAGVQTVLRFFPGNDSVFGKFADNSGTLSFSRKERNNHLYVCGGTGTGKTKYSNTDLHFHAERISELTSVFDGTSRNEASCGT